MSIAAPLPADLAQRYLDWKATRSTTTRARFRDLAANGQSPQAMVISCSDSRVNATALFGADAGAFFMHRNVANLVPACDQDGDNHATAAAVEYAVGALHVPHLIVLGHSGCGGVAGCHALCSGTAPELESPSSFVGRWIGHLRPAFARIDHSASTEDQLRALEHQGIIMSMENLMGYPFVRDALAAGKLSIHGLWNDIGSGDLLWYDGTEFIPVTS